MTSEFTIVSGNVQDTEVFRVIAFIDQLREKRSTASGVYKYTAVDGKWSIFNLDWSAIDLCMIKHPDLTLAIMSESGTIMLVNKDGYKTIQIAPGTSGPSGYGPLRNIHSLESSAYVVGMSRQVYRILADGTWTTFEDGILRPSAIEDVCGFNSIHGVGENLLYAVGFNGEIWINKSGKWAQVQSPTNVILHCVRVINKENVFIGGQGGILLHGTNEIFATIDTNINNDIWSMEVFRDRLYFCTEKKLGSVNFYV
jgi:hypothetical protein